MIERESYIYVWNYSFKSKWLSRWISSRATPDDRMQSAVRMPHLAVRVLAHRGATRSFSPKYLVTLKRVLIRDRKSRGQIEKVGITGQLKLPAALASFPDFSNGEFGRPVFVDNIQTRFAAKGSRISVPRFSLSWVNNYIKMHELICYIESKPPTFRSLKFLDS